MTTMLDELDELVDFEFEVPAQPTPLLSVCSIRSGPLRRWVRGTGILIGPRTVLTAGRVVHDAAGQPMIASHITVNGAVDVPAALATAVRVIPHPAYVPYTGTDVAILRLDKLLGRTLGHWTQPIGIDVFDRAQPPIAKPPVLSLSGYADRSDPYTQVRLDNIGFARYKGLITYIRFKGSAQRGSPVWTAHPSAKGSILIGVHLGRASGRKAAQAAALTGDIVNFINANKA